MATSCPEALPEHLQETFFAVAHYRPATGAFYAMLCAQPHASQQGASYVLCVSVHTHTHPVVQFAEQNCIKNEVLNLSPTMYTALRPLHASSQFSMPVCMMVYQHLYCLHSEESLSATAVTH
eukprot:364830-Chlamydomonas_euryale.AAC.13